MINKNLFKLSIIVPCYNENNTIDLIIKKIEDSLNVYNYINYEIIIIDDFSTDGTRDKLKKFKNYKNTRVFFHDNNLGKGAAIHTAIQHFTGDLLLIQDADLEYDPFDYDKLLLPFFETDADIVYGSRFLGGGKYVRIHFFWHYLANKILTFLCNLFINLNLTDMETGYKVFKSSAIKSIILNEKSFAFASGHTIFLQ